MELQATGGVPPLRWAITAGALPPGLQLDAASGVIAGVPGATGDFSFTVTVSDSTQPAHSISHEFPLTVAVPLLLEWSKYPQVSGNTISGAVHVINGSDHEFDQTVIILAVNEVGKAFALGYQHFKLKPRSDKVEIPFGSSLPLGNYVVNVDAIAEVESKGAIYRDRLETRQALAVTTP